MEPFIFVPWSKLYIMFLPKDESDEFSRSYLGFLN